MKNVQAILEAHGCELLEDKIIIASHNISWNYHIDGKLYIEELQGLPSMVHDKASVAADILVKSITGYLTGFENPTLTIRAEQDRLLLLSYDTSNPNVAVYDDIVFQFDAAQPNHVQKAYQHYQHVDVQDMIDVADLPGIHAMAALARDLYLD